MSIRHLEKRTISLHDVKHQFKSFVYEISEKEFEKGDRARDGISDTKQLEARNKWMREKFIESMGGLPSLGEPLNSKVMGVVRGEGYRIEKIVFESRPSVYVTSNLYIPDSVKTPTGAVLFLCGHHDQAKHAEEYQIVCQYLVNAGLIVLAVDPVGQGERFSYYEPQWKKSIVRCGTQEHDYAGSQCLPLGDGIARYFVHDAMRAVDYLISRPEVDAQNIGVTGNSGGGTQTSLMMMCDPRIAAAAPATFVMNRQTYLYTNQAQDAEQIWNGMTKLGFDHEDILMQMAPRPVLVLAATYDFFPIEGTRRTVERTKRFWDMYERLDAMGLYEEAIDHRYSPAMAQEAAAFFAKHLSGKAVSLSRRQIKPFPPAELMCCKSGQIRGEFNDSRGVHEENSDRLGEVEEKRDGIPDSERKIKALQWLTSKVRNSRKSHDLNARHEVIGLEDEFIVYSSLWWSQEGLLNHAYTFLDQRLAGATQPMPATIAVWDGGTSNLQAHRSWIRETCRSGRTVVVLDTTGIGPLLPYGSEYRDPLAFYGVIHKLANDLLWLGDSLAAMRTYDVLRAVEMIAEWSMLTVDDLQLYGDGRQGIYAELASCLESRIVHTQTINVMHSVADWVRMRHYDEYDISSIIIPEMLTYLDLPDLKRWGFVCTDET